MLNDTVNQFYRSAFERQTAEDEAEADRKGPCDDATMELIRRYVVVPRCEFNDGFHVSIQAGKGKYSAPRITGHVEGYTEFELGFPSAADDLIQPYAEEGGKPTETVYGYVPVAVVVALAEKHGGIKGAYVAPAEAAP
jgi:hypothetical protein